MYDLCLTRAHFASLDQVGLGREQTSRIQTAVPCDYAKTPMLAASSWKAVGLAPAFPPASGFTNRLLQEGRMKANAYCWQKWCGSTEVVTKVLGEDIRVRLYR